MSLIPVKYPLDPTGVATSNKVSAEPHTLRNSKVRPVVLKYGAFFNESIAIRDAASGRILTRDVDYYGTVLYQLPTSAYGKEIYQIVVIVDQTCGADILVDYQALGGEYSYSWDAIVQMMQTLDLDNRPTAFAYLLGRPEAYNPAPHLHDAGDVYGFEYVVAAIERVAQAIRVGSGAAEKGFFDYVDSQITQVNSNIQALTSSVTSPDAIKAALGYTPINKEGDSFNGPMLFKAGMTLNGYFKEKISKINATTNNTVLDLSTASIFIVTLMASTSIVFDMTKITTMAPDESLSFTLILINDASPGRAVSFPVNVGWADKVIPPRSTGANARDEFYFSTFDSGANYTGSLSNQNVG